MALGVLVEPSKQQRHFEHVPTKIFGATWDSPKLVGLRSVVGRQRNATSFGTGDTEDRASDVHSRIHFIGLNSTKTSRYRDGPDYGTIMIS